MLSKKLAAVDKTRCVACGVCENNCPLRAVKVLHMVCVLPDGNHDARYLQAEKQRIIKDNRKEPYSWLN